MSKKIKICQYYQKPRATVFFDETKNCSAPKKVQRGRRLLLKKAKLIQIMKNNRGMLWGKAFVPGEFHTQFALKNLKTSSSLSSSAIRPLVLLIKAAFPRTFPKLVPWTLTLTSVTKVRGQKGYIQWIVYQYVFFFFKLSKIRQTSYNGDQYYMYFIETCFVHNILRCKLCKVTKSIRNTRCVISSRATAALYSLQITEIFNWHINA